MPKEYESLANELAYRASEIKKFEKAAPPAPAFDPDDYVSVLNGGLRPRVEVEREQAEREAETHAKVLDAVNLAIRNGEAILAGETLDAAGWCGLAGAFVDPTLLPIQRSGSWDATQERVRQILVGLREIRDRG